MAQSTEFESFIKLAPAVFDHFDEHWHNHLVQAGALKVLSKSLERHLSEGSKWADIEKLCMLLRFLLRCSDQEAIRSIELSGMLHSIVGVLYTGNVIGNVEVASSISCLVARMSTFHLNLRGLKSSAKFLSLCREILECSAEDNGHRPWLFLTIQLMSGVSQHKESKDVVMGQPGLFESLVSVLSNSFRKGDTMNYSTAQLLHALAKHTQSKVVMLHNGLCLNLVGLLLNDNCNNTRHEAILAFKLLAIERFGRKQLFRHGACPILDAACVPSTIQLSSMKTLLYLLSDKTTRTLLFTKRPDFLSKLTEIATSKSSTHAGLLSSQIIKRVSVYVRVNHQEGSDLLESILRLISSSEGNVRLWGTRALLEQVSNRRACLALIDNSCISYCSRKSRFKGSSFLLSRTKQIIQALTHLLSDCAQRVRATAIEVLFNLASHEVNSPILAADRQLMESLAALITKKHNGDPMDRKQAILVVLCLGRDEKSKVCLAKHYSIVESLARFGISNDNDTELRGAALHGVIWLASLL